YRRAGRRGATDSPPRLSPFRPRLIFRGPIPRRTGWRPRAFPHGRFRMPIPTDTFRNIRRLNWFFAGTAILLLLLMGASVMQDYHKSWRQPQQSGEVWEAALIDDKVSRSLTPDKKA